MQHVFGPVPSRRLGRSLGVDLIPFKTCTFDCLYCQLGRTDKTTAEREEFVPVDLVVDEIREGLVTGPDYITLSGSGEPTLYSKLGELIQRIRSTTDVPVAVITNGSLLWNREVREQLMEASLVIPSLDAGDRVMFETVNRPHDEAGFEKLVEGLILFREEYRGPYWLEVFLLAGLTDKPGEVVKIATIANGIRPDRVQLNTCVRPPAHESATMVDPQRLLELSKLFSPKAEIIADFREGPAKRSSTVDDEEIIKMLLRRPCTARDVAAGLGMDPDEVVKRLDSLVMQGRVEPSGRKGDHTHYLISKRR